MRDFSGRFSKATYLTLVTAICVSLYIAMWVGTASAVITSVTAWGTSGTGNGQFAQPTAVAVAANGDVYIGESGNTRIQVFSSTGTFKSVFNNTNVSSPHGMVFDSGGNLWVADSSQNHVVKLNASGTLVATYGSLGAGNGQFNNPQDVAIDSAGNFYVTDYGNSRIQKFTSAGTYVTQWGSSGAGNGQFNAPMGIAIDGSDNIYVSEDTNCRVQKFTSSGTFVTKWGSAGSADGQFLIPQHLSVDASGGVYVVDSFNARLEKFNATGTYLDKYTGPFNSIYNVRVDNLGNLYVVEYGGNQIQKLNDGAFAPPNSAPNAPFNLGPASVVSYSTITTNQPTLTFSLSDPNAADTIKYNIQIDDTFNFSSPLVDYTSALGAQGLDSFTVGQAAGGGTYTVGSQGQTLPDAWYYWRIKAIDNSGASSPFVMANGNAIAFIVNTSSGTSTPTVTTPIKRRTYSYNTYDLPIVPATTTATTTSQPVTLNDFSAYISGKGQEITLSAGQSVNYLVDGLQYTAVVKQVTSDTAIITLSPVLGDVVLKKGQPKTYDLTGDGKNDMTVTLIGVNDGMALVRFAAYVKGASTTQPSVVAPKTAAESKTVRWILIGGAGVAVVACATYVVVRIRRRL